MSCWCTMTFVGYIYWIDFHSHTPYSHSPQKAAHHSTYSSPGFPLTQFNFISIWTKRVPSSGFCVHLSEWWGSTAGALILQCAKTTSSSDYSLNISSSFMQDFLSVDIHHLRCVPLDAFHMEDLDCVCSLYGNVGDIKVFELLQYSYFIPSFPLKSYAF